VWSSIFINDEFMTYAYLVDDRITFQFLAKSLRGYSFIEIGREMNSTHRIRFFFYYGALQLDRNNGSMNYSTQLLTSHLYEERIIYDEMISKVTLNCTELLLRMPVDNVWVRYGFRNYRSDDFIANPYSNAKILQLNYSTSYISPVSFGEPMILNRIEYIRLTWCFVALAPYLGNFLLIFFFISRQPLKSRGIYPMLSSVFLLIHFFRVLYLLPDPTDLHIYDSWIILSPLF
jgi:hypothetical protein